MYYLTGPTCDCYLLLAFSVVSYDEATSVSKRTQETVSHSDTCINLKQTMFFIEAEAAVCY